MVRDIRKWIDEGQKIIKEHERVDMTAYELDYIYRSGRQGKEVFDIIHLSFLLGVSIGHRIGRKGARHGKS